MFFDDLTFKEKIIPKTILGYSPFVAEPFLGHRSMLYKRDLYDNPQAIADVIVESYNQGVRAINLFNDSQLLKAYDIACDQGCNMKVIATIGKTEVDYLNPNYEIAKETDWDDDIELFNSYDCPLMLVDEFIVDAYDWRLTSKILDCINDTDSLSGLITAFPLRTTNLIPENLNMDLFDFYMVPFNAISYMMDITAFNASQREEFKQKLTSLNKKVIASRIFACGILKPKEAFEFYKKIDYIDLISIGVAKVEEAREDFTLLKEY
ncbi:MAG: hypothetical protein MJ226_06880 [archaeon]|uniref:Uncharacterized protein n=2 Tax=Methanobacteriaceae TaxID=2159 RepID=A0A3N5AYY7_9EURY|nr:MULTISPECIES: hypothetical protein [Methanobrevibacter]MCQ2971289.1 hypothetical protein [archaeon]RPF50476.1 hypothetical protein EDC42_1755 [Methanobrevibacter gottschalkii DSM 11977]